MLPEVSEFYHTHPESGRLQRTLGPLESARMQELMARFFPQPPAVVLDIGGGPGAHACWLAELGYQVHLIDSLPLHVEQGQAASAKAALPITSIQLADARHLDFSDASADAILMAGPLYHLTERDDRLRALREAARVLRTGGMLLGVTISRYSSVHVGLVRGCITQPDYLQMCKGELATGQHIRPPSLPNVFPRAYFHRATELKAELEDAGLVHEASFAVEAGAWLIPELEQRWNNESDRQAILDLVRWLERDPVAIGLSAHIAAVARKSVRNKTGLEEAA